jgi:small subunit ribosomal protein S17
MSEKNPRKQQVGIVKSAKMQKTVIVEVSRTMKHPLYEKIVTRTKKYYAHTEKEIAPGEKVVIEESRPFSKLKRWRVVNAV